MKNAGLFVGGFALVWLTLGLGFFAVSIYGLVLAFKASIILGLIALIVEPSPLALGLVALFGHPDIAHRIAAWLGL